MGAMLRCELFPSDLDGAVTFYVRVLGFAVVRDERAAPHPYVALERDQVRPGLARRPAVDQAQRRPPTGVELVLEVDDLNAEYDRVLAAGCDLAEDMALRPWGLRDFRVLDPSGYYWRITSLWPPG
jgi:predicted enzyme related to lactoylglutathione lyase